jgi:hypothetical protein
VDKPRAIVKLSLKSRVTRDIRLCCGAVLTNSIKGSCDTLVSSSFFLVLSSTVKMPRNG